MSRRKRSTANALPNISLFGTSLDRLLNGMVTPELAAEIRRSRIEEGAVRFAEVASEAPMISRASPLIAVMVRSTCQNCRRNEDRFSHLARRTTERIASGEATSFTTIFNSMGAKPAGLLWTTETPAFCLYCLPDTLPELNADGSTRHSGNYTPASHAAIHTPNGIGNSKPS